MFHMTQNVFRGFPPGKTFAGSGVILSEDAPRPFNGHALLVQEDSDAPEKDEVRVAVQPLPFGRTHGAQLREFRLPETQYVAFQLQKPRGFPNAIRPSSHAVPLRNASFSGRSERPVRYGPPDF